MKKAKYFYNTSSLRYEKIEMTWKRQTLRLVGFLSATAVFAFIIVVFTFQFIDSPKERQLRRELQGMEFHLEQFQSQLGFYDQVMAELQERDESIYRIIFEADPIPASIRQAGFGGSDRFEQLSHFSNSELLTNVAEKIEKLGKQLYIQSKSYDDITEMLRNKEEMFASIPAIQPLSNSSLKRVASGFGKRLHPIYKTRKMHWGLDFSAPQGTPVYATGKGKVVKVKKLKRGYGHHVVIDHGFNYQTIYAHLHDISVKKGDRLMRGDVIGTVGNTGTSTAPHLHYEVVKNGKKINPINFFYNDLSPKEYEEMLEISSRHNQSFD